MEANVDSELGLTPVSTQYLSIDAFGSKRAEASPCDVVRVKMRTNFEQVLELDHFVTITTHM